MTNFLESLFSLSGKTAIVAGSSRGIGAEISLSFINAGANVVCFGRSKSPEMVELKKYYKKCDIKNRNSFRKLCHFALKKYSSIDIFVNAVGITKSNKTKVDSIKNFYDIIYTNLIAAYNSMETVSEYMNSGGSIINLTSIGSFQGFPNNPGYVASKGGLRLLTKAMAIDLSSKSIRINNLAPGYIKTDMTIKSFLNKEQNKKRMSRMINDRWGTPDDIVGTAIFLASDASKYINGSDILVDGGWMAKGL